MAQPILGSSTNYHILDLDAAGVPIEASETFIANVIDSSPLAFSNSEGSNSKVRPDGGVPIADTFLTELGSGTFGLTLEYDGSLEQAKLQSSNRTPRDIAIRLKRYEAGSQVGGALTFICYVLTWSETRPKDNAHQIEVTFTVKIPESPMVYYHLEPIRLASGGTRSVPLGTIFAARSALTYALGTIDPSSNASAAAVYTASTKTLAITADASRTGTTTIPITATDANSRTASYSIVVEVA